MVITKYHIFKKVEEVLRDLTRYDPGLHGELLDFLITELEKRNLRLTTIDIKDSIEDYPFITKIKIEGLDKFIVVKRKRISKITPGFIKKVIKDEYLIEFDNFLAEGFVPGEYIEKWEGNEE